MRRRTLARDVVGTTLMFLALVILTIAIIYGEAFLENFKSH
jgi:hypothetical protein